MREGVGKPEINIYLKFINNAIGSFEPIFY